MENGKVVAENPEVLKHIGPPQKNESNSGDGSAKLTANPDGSVPVPCGNPPERPTDKLARTTVIDEEQGVVVSFGIVHGISEPYVITNPTESACGEYPAAAYRRARGYCLLRPVPGVGRSKLGHGYQHRSRRWRDRSLTAPARPAVEPLGSWANDSQGTCRTGVFWISSLIQSRTRPRS